MKEKYVRDVETDLYFANKILDHSDIDTKHFGEYSHIFRFTNEPIHSLSKYLNDRENVLSVTCSGDQVLKCISEGSKKIDTFDISIFPKYFLDMKLAACKKLSKEEFYNMFYNPDFENMNLSYLYNKFNVELPMASRFFWDGLFSKYSWEQIYSSDLFTSKHGLGWYKGEERALNSYFVLDDIDYDKLQEKAKNAKVESITCDISAISDKVDQGYDLVFLSNIVDYVPVDRFKEYIKNLKVNENGIILSTFGYTNQVNRMSSYKVLKDEGFEEEKTDRITRLLVKKF